MVDINLPPPTRPEDPQFLLLPRGRPLTRIYNRDHLGATDYNKNGPRARFDHHEQGLPRIHIGRGTYYAADDLAGCVIEVFGDTGVIEPRNFWAAEIEPKASLKLLDLTRGNAWKAGTMDAIAKDSGRATTQAWARYFYERYRDVDGIVYENAHNSARAYLLFERAGTLLPRSDLALSDPILQDALFLIADELGLLYFG